MSKTKLPVDLDDLVHALTWNDDMMETNAYLDRETGKIVTVFEDDLPEDDLDGDINDLDDQEKEFREQALLVENHPERFIHIEPIESHEAFRVMEDFLGEVRDEAARERLATALEKRKPFRAFKSTLEDYPKLRQQWFDFEDKYEQDAARAWLASNDIETTWQRPQPKEK